MREWIPSGTVRKYMEKNGKHRQKVIFKNAGMGDLEGGLHIFRKTFKPLTMRQGLNIKAILWFSLQGKEGCL